MPTSDTTSTKADDGGSNVVVPSTEDGQITNWDLHLHQEVSESTTNETVSETIRTETTSNSSGQTGRLTVHRKWKIDTALEFKANVKKKPSRIVPVLKVFATIIFGSLLFANILASKYFVFALAKRLAVTKQLNSKERIQDIRCFILLFFLILCPNVISFLRTSWIGGFRKDVPWPTKVQIFKALTTTGLETCGLCIFVYKIFSFYSLLTSQMLLNSVILLPSYQTLWKCYKNRQQINSFYKIIYFSGAMLATTASVCTTVLAIMESEENYTYIWHVVTGSLCLSISWSNCFWHGVQKLFSSIPKKEDIPHQTYQSFSTAVNSNDGASSSGFVSEDTVSDTPSTSTPAEQKRDIDKLTEQSSFWKLGMVSNLFRISFTCLFSFLFYFVDNQNYPPELVFSNTMFEEFKKAWAIPFDTQLVYLLGNILVSIVGFFLGFYACHACIKRGAFAKPILASLIVVPIILVVPRSCQLLLEDASTVGCSLKDNQLPLVYCTVVLFVLSFIFVSIGLFKKEKILLDKEENIFWVPAYNGVMLDQWLLVNKKDQFICDEDPGTESIHVKPHPRVYICTTMYHETSEEMKELLKSINRINTSRIDGRFYESHIVFDGGLSNTSLSKYALQLIILLKETLGINPATGTKVVTPYGMKLSWQLPKERGMKSMYFNIHLKDNLKAGINPENTWLTLMPSTLLFKVKNKKRWSQIMYMSFILDFLTKDAPHEECYILTTDADVKFTPSSVEALLDLMIRDDSVGAVCARTHPMGNGPLAWYQNFDYAVGHWFQKASEHVLGSVLCAPGCFSVYRCQAIRDVLPKYATNVECAEDFLIKDMGEDRWLCTLLIQCGWRIEYCAAAKNSTNCPDQFDEFFKQRRRWIVSTLANMMLIINKWSLIRKFNNQISVLFLLYQCFLLLSTLIGPCTVALLVSGGLSYSWGINSLVSIIIQLLIALFYILICLYAPQNYQLNIAKILTFFYAVIMCAVVVGTTIQIAQDLNGGAVKPTTEPPTSNLDINIPVSVTTMFFGLLIGLFTTTALLHPTESFCLLSGCWYLLCLPAGFIVLILYSICNITDRSWGTREEKVFTTPKPQVPWIVSFSKFWKILCFCCFKTKLGVDKTDDMTTNTVTSGLDKIIEETLNVSQPSTSQQTPTESLRAADLKPEVMKSKDESCGKTLPVPVEEWLPEELRSTYLRTFKENGFDNTMFIFAMNKKDLKNMGLENKSHIQYILDKIKLLPTFEVEYHIPDSVNDWLDGIGLEMYKTNFESSVIIEVSNLKILKSYSEQDVIEQLGITKKGHIKRLLYAIPRLRNPTEVERRAKDVKELIEDTYTHHLGQANAEEITFWNELIDHCLTPDSGAFSIESELKDNLNNLRLYWLMIMAISNTLWLITITTLASQAELTVFGANPLSLVILVIFSVIFVIQFLCVFVHRFQTFTHFLARAPYRCNKDYKSSVWYKGIDLQDPEDVAAISSVRDASRRAQISQQQRLLQKKFNKGLNDERQRLLS